MNRFILYETASRFYLIGQDVSEKYYKVLKIDRTSPPGVLNIFEDDIVYDKIGKDQLLTTIDEGNKASGGLRMKCNAWGVLGFVRFTEAYYMVLITKRLHAAVIGGHYISQIEATEGDSIDHWLDIKIQAGQKPRRNQISWNILKH